MKNLTEKSYNTVLSETSDFFQAQGMSILGEGFKEIATNPALLETYVESLTEGAQADHAAAMAQLMENANAHILHESSITGIQPVASLSMPVIRKLWPKFALKDALKTEVAKSPRFVVPYARPYMQKGDEEKIYLPKGLVNGVDGASAAVKKTTLVKGVAVAKNGASTVTWDTEVTSSPSAAKKQPLDELVIDAVYVKAATSVSGTTYYGIDDEGVITVKESFESDKSYEQISVPFLGKRLDITGTGVYTVKDGGATDGQLIVRFQGGDCTAYVAYIGAKDILVSLRAAVSSEYNEEGYSVSFDIARMDIDIPTGQHLNANLPIEALNDMMALYQIDGTKETVDLMTNIFAMKLDLEVMDFIENSFVNQPGVQEFVGYPDCSEYLVTFDCKPAAGFAGGPQAWREELKPLIDHLAQKIKSETYLQAGTFALVGHPIDIQLITNVDWSFRGGQGTNMDGVDVDYSLGTYVGANAYKVIASNNVPQGAMYIVFTPSNDTQMTYKYYPYTFTCEMGYTDPNRSRVPSIMMTKRHTFQEFLPAVGCIHIENNDGKSLFRQYVPTMGSQTYWDAPATPTT